MPRSLAVAVPAGAQSPAHVATDAQEVALGAALAERFAEERGLVPQNEQSRRIEAYLQTVADSIGRHARRRLPWTIHSDAHPGIHSGFALPGGHVVIWGGILSYMTTEDERAAIVAHEIVHADDEAQVRSRIDSLARAGKRDVTDPAQWRWQEFGASYGDVKENRCDHEGARLLAAAGYSPRACETLLRSFVVVGAVHAPGTPAPKAIAARVEQIRAAITEMHWEALTRTRPLRLPLAGG